MDLKGYEIKKIQEVTSTTMFERRWIFIAIWYEVINMKGDFNNGKDCTGLIDLVYGPLNTLG